MVAAGGWIGSPRAQLAPGTRRRQRARSSRRPSSYGVVAVCETEVTLRVLGSFRPTRTILRGAREEGLVPSEQPPRSAAEQLAVEARTNRRTALVALHGELDIVTVSKVAEVLDGLEPQADGV